MRALAHQAAASSGTSASIFRTVQTETPVRLQGPSVSQPAVILPDSSFCPCEADAEKLSAMGFCSARLQSDMRVLP